MTDCARELPAPGFNFGNCRRNALMLQNGFKPPKATSTGTTIAGVVFKDGVVLGADTRATSGPIVSDKNCEKIHYLAPNIYCCGAGTAADTEMTTNMIASELELHRLHTGRTVPVVAAKTLLKQKLFRYEGYIGAHLIVGGVDDSGSYITSIANHGSSDTVPYTTMGSGSLAAMSVFEKGWRPNMELQEAKNLVQDAINAGIYNDLGSGSNVDLVVITKRGVDRIRGYKISAEKGERQGTYDYKPGTTRVLDTKIIDYEVIPGSSEEMEIA